MLVAITSAIVEFCRRFAVVVTLAGLVLTVVLGQYAATHFKINTDINQLMATDLDWRIREKTLERAFPQKVDTLLVVVEGDTPEMTENAAAALTEKLTADTAHFTSVTRPDSIPFFRKNGLLFLSKLEISGILDALIEAQPMIGTLTSDPSLRGFFSTFGLMAVGVQHGALDKERLEKPLAAIADTIEAATQGHDKPMGWQSLMTEQKPSQRDLRKYILTKPVLDFTALQPGESASSAIRALAKEMELTPEHGVHVRLTGSVPLNDEEFASVADGTGMATALSGVLVFVILLLALRSFRIIMPILLTLIAGLVATTSFALATVGSLNLISVAFAVMFIGIAVDFGIQFGVRYRDQRHLEPDHTKALRNTVGIIAIPLAMAAGSTSLGFFAFIPTAYRGVSELGLIAGGGMLIAFALNITLMPALLTLFKPPAEPEAVGYKWAAPIDRLIEQHRRTILIAAGVVTVIGLGIMTQLRFDFDPLNLKDPKTESVSTLLSLMNDPDFGAYTVETLRPSLAEAEKLADDLGKLPEVDHAMTVASFIPEDQDAKLALIKDASQILTPTLSLPQQPAPSDAEIEAALKTTADAFAALPDIPSAQRIAKDLNNVVTLHDHALLERLHKNLVTAMQTRLGSVRDALSPFPVTRDNITDDLRRDWVTADGQYLVQAYPKGNPRDHKILTAFTTAVRGIAPDATGAPISIQESGKTVTGAFIHAGGYALVAIGLLALLILRRAGDVIRLLTPLILAGILTLATMVVIRLPLNFANIIALPLLLSLGVSYAIYFVSYWRAGLSAPLQSSMARAVLFSAATTLVSFGSLSLSAHPGTSGMGELLTIALLYSLTCTFFILPALLERPKNVK